MGGHTQAEVARASGLKPQLVGEYVAGRKTPGSENLFALADALDVEPRWLLRGQGLMSKERLPEQEDLLFLPVLDYSEVSITGRPLNLDTIRISKDALARLARPSEEMFLTEMSASDMPTVARQGELVLCRRVARFEDGRVHLLFLDDDLLVRRVKRHGPGFLLTTDNPAGGGFIDLSSGRDEAARARPIARVLAAFMQPA